MHHNVVKDIEEEVRDHKTLVKAYRTKNMLECTNTRRTSFSPLRKRLAYAVRFATIGAVVEAVHGSRT